MKKTEQFRRANARSPVVYASLVEAGWFYRLQCGATFKLNTKQAREIGPPRMAHLEDA